MTALFGKTISRTFYPEDALGAAVQLPSQAPAIYLFESEPSLDYALSGTGALAAALLWDQATSSPYGCDYELDAVEDPTPDSNIPSRGYWEALNFILEAGGETQTVKRYFEIGRITGASDRPGTTITDLKNVFPYISTYASDADIEKALVTAEKQMRSDIEAQGVKWPTVANIPQTFLALAYLATSLACFGQMLAPGDRHSARAQAFEALYKQQLKNIPIQHDADGDGVPEAEKPGRAKYSLVMK